MEVQREKTEKFRDTLHIPISHVCNNNCIFCNEDRQNWKKTNALYSADVVESLLVKYRPQLTRVNFTSGEPLLNPDAINYVRLARELGYTHISVTTNGRMLAYGKYALDLVNAGVTEVIVSIHGHTAAIHNGLTRTKGSFDQTLRGLENMSRLAKGGKFRFTAAVTLNKRNYRHFGEMVEFLQQYRVFEIVFNVVQPVHKNMAEHFDKMMPRYSEVAAVIEGYYRQHPGRFERNLVGRSISVIDLPLCQSKLLTAFFGYGETRIVEDVQRTDATEFDPSQLSTKVLADNSGDKVKRSECKSCDYYRRCNGIYRMYVERFGWDEFVPVVH